MRVLVTGSEGAVGRPVCAELETRGHEVVRFDLSRGDDITDRPAVRRAVGVEGGASAVDALVHLAAEPDDAPFIEKLMPPNVSGLFQVMDACRAAEVGRVVLASSCQVVSGLPKGEVADRDSVRPRNHYALTKRWAEQMGEMYADRFGLSVIAVRLGWVVRDQEEAARLEQNPRGALWYLSQRDAGRLFALAVEAERARAKRDFAMIYGAGSAGAELADLSLAEQRIGFFAKDRFPEGLPFDPTG